MKMRRTRNIGEPALSSETVIKVRFSEVDSMRIVWHGDYVKYFEDGRENFGEKYPGLGYLDIYRSGYTAPIVDMHLQYLRPLTIGEQAVIETRYIKTEAAKLCYEYEIRNMQGEVVTRGRTIQVFVDVEGNLSLNNPEFYEEWKRKWLK